MSYALMSDDLLLQLEAAGLSRDARLLYVEGIVHCATALSDGAINVRLARLSDADDVDGCARELVEAELWRETSRGFEVCDYLDHQQSAEEVERKRADARRRSERSRRHKRGDHSMCFRGGYCPDGALSPSSRVTHAHGAQDVRSPILTNPSQREGEGKDKKGAGAPAPGGAVTPALDDGHQELIAGLLAAGFERSGHDVHPPDGVATEVLDSVGDVVWIVSNDHGLLYAYPVGDNVGVFWSMTEDSLRNQPRVTIKRGDAVYLDLNGLSTAQQVTAVTAIHRQVRQIVEAWEKTL